MSQLTELSKLERVLFDEAGAALLLYDPSQDLVLDANPVALHLTGLSVDELRGRSWSELFHADNASKQELANAILAMKRYQVENRFWLHQPAGQVALAIDLTLVPLASQNAETFLFIARRRYHITEQDYRVLLEEAELRHATILAKQRRIESQLRVSEKKYREVVETSHNLIWSVDDTGRWTFVNRKAAIDIYGYEPEEMLGKHFTEFETPEQALIDLETFSRIKQGQPHFHYETVHRRKDGTPVYLIFNAIVLHDEHGNVAGSTGTAIDITQNRLVQLKLEETQQRFHAFMEKIPIQAYIKDAQGRLVYVNQAFCNTFGQLREDYLGRVEHELWPTELAKRLKLHSQQALGGDLAVEMRERIPDVCGKMRDWWVVRFPFRDPLGQKLLGCIAIDLTEREQIEADLRQSEERYRMLFDHLEQKIFLKDRSLRFVAANPKFCRLLGKQEIEIQGKTEEELFPLELAKRRHDADLIVLTEGRPYIQQEQITDAQQSRTFRVNRTPVRDDKGIVVAVLGIGWDVTDQLILEAQLRHVQKMDAIGQLAGGIAHDFNNLLTVMLGNLSFILAELPAGEWIIPSLRAAENACLRAKDLTRSLLSIARRTILQTTSVRLDQVVQETYRLTRTTLTPSIEVEIEIPVDLWRVEADAGQLNQVFMNLTLNARDAMPRGGRLRFEACNFVPNQTYLSSHLESRTGEFVRIRVQDTGEGMPAEVRQRIFEPFFTTKEQGKGTGLGLAMVFSIIRQHQGWIEVQSIPGQGTTFDLYLPRATNVPVAPIMSGPQETLERGHELILIVDDEEMIRDISREILTLAGYEVVTAEDGIQAVEIYRRHHDRIALVILDSVMPRLSGHETLQALAKIDANVQILFSSGYSTELEEVSAYPQVRGDLPKPYRASELTQKVREILDEA